MDISPTRELAKQINQTSIASDEQVVAMVTSLPREELAKQINQTSIASDEQVLAMVISTTRKLAKQINQTSIASDRAGCGDGHLSHARARQADQSNKHCF